MMIFDIDSINSMLLLSIDTLILDLIEHLLSLRGKFRKPLRKLIESLILLLYFIQKHLVIMLCHQD